MWKLGRSRVLLDEPPEEEDGLRGGAPPATAPAAAQVRGRRGGGARGAGRVMRVGMSGAEAWPRSGGGAQVGRAGEARAARPFNFPRLVRARPLCPVVTAPPATLRMTEPSAPPPLARVWDGGRSSRRWEPRAVAFQRRGGNCLPSGRDPGPGPGPSVQRRVRGRAPGWAGFTGEAWTGGGHRPAGEVPGATFRGWKEVTSLFNKDDEQQLLEGRKSPKSRATNLRLKEELKTEKKSGFWDNLVLKQNIQSKKPDEIEGWEPPKLALEDVAADSGGPVSDRVSRPGWQEDTKGSSKYTSLAGAGSSSRWSLRSAGKLVSIRRQSRGHLTDDWEELE
uniref:Testis development related protein n=2 Tax=Bos TaxID=9903 RepID=A0AAA9TVJ2_BOVIN